MMITIEVNDAQLEALQRLIVDEDAGDGFSLTDAQLRREVIESILVETGDFLVKYYGYHQDQWPERCEKCTIPTNSRNCSLCNEMYDVCPGETV